MQWLTGGVMEFYCKYKYIITYRYEMLNALPPFYHENVEKMYHLIKTAELKFSKRVVISDDAKDLITKVSIDIS